MAKQRYGKQNQQKKTDKFFVRIIEFELNMVHNVIVNMIFTFV